MLIDTDFNSTTIELDRVHLVVVYVVRCRSRLSLKGRFSNNESLIGKMSYGQAVNRSQLDETALFV